MPLDWYRQVRNRKRLRSAKDMNRRSRLRGTQGAVEVGGPEYLGGRTGTVLRKEEQVTAFWGMKAKF